MALFRLFGYLRKCQNDFFIFLKRLAEATVVSIKHHCFSMRIAAVYFNDAAKRDTTYWNVKREDFKMTCTDIEVEVKPRKKLEAERLTTKLKNKYNITCTKPPLP
ncbi:hypothetical protein [Ruminobacter sp.]|uniref:hypothetical protein n=1 Tax=Ruminobacter sp. TaxID=2774296 RepID=UPI00386C7767